MSKPYPKPIPQLWDLAPKLAEHWEIPKSEIELIKRVGEGQYGEVWYGKWKNRIKVAVKTCKPESMTTEEFLAEATIMKKFRHPRLVALYAVCTKDLPIYIVTEYVSNGCLLEYLKKGDVEITFKQLIYMGSQIAEGMSYLESNQLVHRDLAARNILIGENYTVKIADFGLARDLNYDNSQRTMEEVLPIKWCALEVIERNEYSSKSDVWSFGIVIMEMCTYGEKPYGDWDAKFTYSLLKEGYRMPRPDHMPRELYKTILRCWDAEPINRFTFEYLCEYFGSYNIYTEKQFRSLDELPEVDQTRNDLGSDLTLTHRRNLSGYGMDDYESQCYYY